MFHNSQYLLADAGTILFSYSKLSIFELFLILEILLKLCFSLVYIKETERWMSGTFTK